MIVELHCDRIRCLGYLRFKEHVQALVARKIRSRVGPICQQAMLLALTRERQTINYTHMVRGHRLKQIAPIVQKAFDSFAVKQAGGIFKATDDRAVVLPKRKREIDHRRDVWRRNRDNPKTRQLKPALWRILPNEHRLEYRGESQ